MTTSEGEGSGRGRVESRSLARAMDDVSSDFTERRRKEEMGECRKRREKILAI